MTFKKVVVTLASFFALLNITSGSIPSAPRNLAVDKVGSRSINISWTRPAQDGNSSQLNYVVFYKARDEGAAAQLVEVKNVTKATLVVKPYKEYEIFVMAENDAGYGPHSFIRSGLTKEEEPATCPISKELYLENVSPDLEVIVKPIPEDDRNGKIIQHVIFFKSKSMGEFENVTVNATNRYDPNGIRYILKNMSYAINYGFKVAAVNSAGMCKGWQSLELFYKNPAPTTTVSPSTTPTPPTTTATATAAPTTTATAAPTTTATAAPTTTATVVPCTTALLETTKSEPEEKTSPESTDLPTEAPSPIGKLASTSESSWLIYVLVALAVIVAIMGITIFLLIWQLYKNHRFYKLRKEQYRMNNTTPNIGADNEAQDNPV